MTTTAVSAWPLRFNYRSPVLGNGYVALVELQGRLLARRDPEENRVWLEGVNPGALAVPVSDILTGNRELSIALTAVFIDFAEEAASFEGFKAMVERFFHDTDAATVAEWEECVSAVQTGRIAAPEGLPVCPAHAPLTVQVTYRSADEVTSKDNPEQPPILAAAA